jgi:hypothetical protein
MSLVDQIVQMHIHNPHAGYDAAEDEVHQYLNEAAERGEGASVAGFQAWLGE